MFRPNKKIRKLEQMLESGNNQEINKLVNAIMENNPKEADQKFTNDLKNKLLATHQNMTKAKNSQKNDDQKFSLWSDFRFRGWTAALATLIIMVLVGIAAYPIIPAPAVKGYLLKGGTREISVNAPFKISFSQLMDNSSVEKAFVIEPEIKGKFNWTGNTLEFKPETQLEIGRTYKITIGSEAKSLLQKPLEGEYSEFYKIVASPRVVLMTPNNDSKGVGSDAKINIMFNRPLTGLTTLEAGRQNFPAIKIEPAVQGRFKWLGTSTLQFIPDRLNLATTYKITVPKGTAVLDGGYTEEEFNSSFETVRPEVLGIMSTDTQNSYDFSPRSKIKLTFNQAVDLGSAAQLVKLHRVEDGKNIVEEVRIRYFTEIDWKAEQKRNLELVEMNQTEEIAEDQSLAGETPKIEVPKREELEMSVMVEPVTQMKADSNYFLEVKADVAGSQGTLGTVEDRNFEFRTSGELKFISANNMIESSTALAYPVFTYSNSLDLRSFQGKVRVEPTAKDEKGIDVQPTISSYSDGAVYIGYDYLPTTDYTIIVAGGIKDIFGNTYNEPAELKFRTGSYKPGLTLEKGTDISVVDGSQKTKFYLKSINISSADVKLKKLSQEQFTGLYGQGWIDYRDPAFNNLGKFDLEASVKVELAANKQGHTLLDLNNLKGENLQPGFYYMEVSNDLVKVTDCRYSWETATPGCTEVVKKEKTLFVVSRSSLAIKTSLNEMLVWATDLKDGKPIQGMKITLINPRQEQTVSGETDVSGLAKIKLPVAGGEDFYRDFLVFGEREGDLAFVHTSWSEGVAPWNFNISNEPISPEYYLYQYTDRPIYRPGQEVYFKGILRQEKDYRFRLPEVKKVKVYINDSQGNLIYEKEHQIESNGTFNGMLKLGENVSSGDYSLRTELIDAKTPSWMNSFYSSFKVYQYRKPEYKLDISPERKEYINGETAKVKVEAGYFFGAPLKNAEIRWTLRAQDYYFILPEELAAKLAGSWFSFAGEGYFCYWGCEGGSEIVSQGSVKANEMGVAEINLPLNINDKKISQIYTLEATVTDANNQSVSNRVSLPVHKGDFYIGIRSQEYIVSTDKPAKFDVLTVSTQGKELPGRTVEVALYERTWNTVKRKNVDGDFYFENSYNDKLVEKKSVKTGENAIGTVEFKIGKGGVYKIEGSAKDGRGNLVSSSTTVYVSSGEFINWGSENNDKIELITDKMEYQVGDTAKVLVKSPYRGVYALVTYERDKVLDQKVIKLESNSQTVEVPITEKFLPNIFVSVVLMKGNSYDAGLMEPAEGAPDERKVASFKVGYTTLQVNTETKRLNIEVNSDKPRYAPGENVKLTLRTTDFAGKTVPAELSVAVVDESVLSLTESVTADLLNVFYRKRLLGVSFAETLTKAISRINVQVEAGMKGGGGADMAKRGVFKDTAHFEAMLKTDANGEGVVEFKLPDNLTTWQVMTIGVSDDSKNERTLVGSNKYSFLVNKDVLVRPVLPRFMTSGDQMQVSAIVHNYTEVDQNVKVFLEASGIQLNDGSERNIRIAAKQSAKTDWLIGVGSTGEAKLTFTAIANNGERGDSIEQILKIKEPSIPEVVAVGKVVSGDAKEIEKIWLPSGLDLTQGNLEIKVGATLAGAINDGLKYLVTFPYGCTEQLTSAILPNIVLKKMINMGKFNTSEISGDEINKNIQGGLQDLYKNQKPNGGFGLWMNSSNNAYLTAYVVFTLNQAKSNGFTVDQRVYDNAVQFLKNYLYQKPDPMEDAKYRANSRAYILFVLNEVGQGDLGMMNNLFEQRNDLRLISKAYLAMTFNGFKVEGEAARPVKDKVATLKKELENAALQTPRGVNFEENDLDFRLYDTNTRSTAVILQTLNRIDAENPLIPKILQSLLRERKAGHFSTTQETSISLLAMLEYLEKSKELSPAYEAIIEMNGENILDENFTSGNLFEVKSKVIELKDLLPNNLENEVAAQKIGQGKLYLDMNLKYYLPLEQQKAENEGIEVLQEYFALDDTEMQTPLNSSKVGENIHGRLTVIVPEDRHYVMIEDFLPAGLEGIDFNLKTSEQALQPDQDCFYYECYQNWYFNHSEVQDDRIMYFADFLPKGVYEIDYYVRATSVGSFADLPTIAQETYFPEVFGRTEGKRFRVTE